MKVFISFCLLLLLPGMFSYSCSDSLQKKFIQKNVLHLSAKIPLPNVSGRIDHLTYDEKDHLVFLAALGNNTVEIINTATRQVVHSIKGLHEPQGVVYIPSLQRLVVANDKNGGCDFFETKNFTLIGSIDLKDDADNVRFDSSSGLLYVGYGSGAIACIDPIQIKLLYSIPLDGHPESFQLSKKEDRMYINVPDADEIEVADITAHSIIAKWKNKNASSNFPMALDEENKCLYIGCRSPARLRTVNTETGEDIQTTECSSDADDVFYSEKDSLIFVSAGKGYIDVFKTNGSSAEQINHIETSSGARTSLWLPDSKQLLLAVPAHNGNDAALWIYNLTKE